MIVNVRGATEKAVTSQPTIRDVCAACNNGPLSDLDNYFCELHDTYFQQIVRPGDSVRFQYDMNLLTRWLLKIWYNVARARGWQVPSQEEIAAYILGKGKRPDDLSIFLQLIIPTKVQRGSIPGHADATEIPPIPTRVEALDLRQLPGYTAAFIVAVKSYYFLVLVEDMKTSLAVRKKVLKAVLKLFRGAQKLTGKNRALVYSSSVDFVKTADTFPFSRNLELARKLVLTAAKRD